MKVPSCTIVWCCTIIYNAYESNNLQFTITQSSLNQINGASLQDNSLLRYTLYTSSVQDLYLPPRFLLQRQSYAYYQGLCLEVVNQL